MSINKQKNKRNFKRNFIILVDEIKMKGKSYHATLNLLIDFIIDSNSNFNNKYLTTFQSLL